MKNLTLIVISMLLLSFCSFAQTQKEALKPHTQKGNSYLGFEFGLSGTGTQGSGVSYVDVNFTPAIKYQYNLINRLSIGGKFTYNLSYEYSNTQDINNAAHESVGASVIVQYYPFKNGLSVEGEFRNDVQFFNNSAEYRVIAGLNVGYTFMIGKNKLAALELKINTLSHQGPEWGRLGISNTPTIGYKIPIGKPKATTRKDAIISD